MQEQDSIPRVDAKRWQDIRANKRNQQTATRIEQIGNSASPEHKRVLQDALNQWAKAVKLSEQFPAITDLLTAEAVYHLSYCTHNFKNHWHERTIVTDVARAIVEGKTAEQCARLFKSKCAYYQSCNDFVDEWNRTGEIPTKRRRDDDILSTEYLYDEKEEDDQILSAEIVTGISKKPTRRVPVTVKRFEKYGILRGDTAIVVMNGDVRVGEFGYFAVVYKPHPDRAAYTYNHFAFVCEQDSTCVDSHYNGKPRTSESLCLRSDDVKKCQGHHNASAHGRVCAIERKCQPVEHTLKLRPFDGRL